MIFELSKGEIESLDVVLKSGMYVGTINTIIKFEEDHDYRVVRGYDEWKFKTPRGALNKFRKLVS